MGSREQMKCIFSNLCKNIQNENSSLPRVLYKYIDIYGACKLMENLSIKYTEPYKFDDIFELSEYENVKYSISPKNAKDHLISSIKQSTEDFKVLNQLKNQIGVACYSTEWDINIMWSLYAGKHMGVVLGFNTQYLAPLSKVNYIHPEEEKDEFQNIVDAAHYMIYTKSSDWSWQKEWRSISLLSDLTYKHSENKPDEDLYLRKIPKDAIAEIYLGGNPNEKPKSICTEQDNFIRLFNELDLKIPLYGCFKDFDKRGKLTRNLLND